MNVEQATLELFRAVGEPFHGSCPSCDADVLVVEVDLVEVTLGLPELYPPGRCVHCKGKGRLRRVERPQRDAPTQPCWACRGTGHTGQPIPDGCIAVDERGEARRYDGAKRKGWVALYLPHACQNVQDVQAA